MTHWKPGDPVVIRGMRKGKIRFVAPAIVVQDDPVLLALYTPPGAECMFPSDAHSSVNMDWEIEARQWENHVLRLVTPGESHSSWLIWKESWELVCWYINLEEPITRTSLGFDSVDQVLDIVVSPDLSEWRWKDEDRFQVFQDLGLISLDRARELRAEGERVIRKIEARKRPFDQDWPNWRPDPSWPMPGLTPGWDSVP